MLDEVVRAGILADDLAQLLLQRWFLEERGPGNWVVPEKPKAFQMWALSPDAWAKTGIKGDMDIALTRADQMNAVMAPYRMGFIAANNDRQGGWQHLYRMLRSGELVICGDACPKLVRAIPSRIHDPDKEDDILKVKGDELDDCCDGSRYGLYDMTQEQFAESASVSVDFLSLAERGINSPSFETLERFARALKVRVAELFNF